jgi:Beta-lactamase
MVMKVKVSPDSIAGDVDEGYGKLADVFRRTMTSGQEIAAAVAVYRDGAKVVDLWGGHRDGITKAPWQEDTAVTVFSTTKGVSSLAVAVAASRGLISHDAKVSDYWPEFAQAGKGSVAVRQLLPPGLPNDGVITAVAPHRFDRRAVTGRSSRPPARDVTANQTATCGVQPQDWRGRLRCTCRRSERIGRFSTFHCRK